MKDCNSLVDCVSLKNTLFTIDLHYILECSKYKQQFSRLGDKAWLHLLQTYSDAYFLKGKMVMPTPRSHLKGGIGVRVCPLRAMSFC